MLLILLLRLLLVPWLWLLVELRVYGRRTVLYLRRRSIPPEIGRHGGDQGGAANTFEDPDGTTTRSARGLSNGENGDG